MPPPPTFDEILKTSRNDHIYFESDNGSWVRGIMESVFDSSSFIYKDEHDTEHTALGVSKFYKHDNPIGAGVLFPTHTIA